MKRSELTKILLRHYDSINSVKAIRTGRSKPSYEKMLDLYEDGIPFQAWKDIRSFITLNDNLNIRESNTTSTQG